MHQNMRTTTTFEINLLNIKYSLRPSFSVEVIRLLTGDRSDLVGEIGQVRGR